MPDGNARNLDTGMSSKLMGKASDLHAVADNCSKETTEIVAGELTKSEDDDKHRTYILVIIFIVMRLIPS